MIKQIDQVNVAIEVRGLVAELHHHPAQLQVFGFSYIGVRAQLFRVPAFQSQ